MELKQQEPVQTRRKYWERSGQEVFPSVWGWKSKWGIKHQAIGQNWMDFLKNIQ